MILSCENKKKYQDRVRKSIKTHDINFQMIGLDQLVLNEH